MEKIISELPRFFSSGNLYLLAEAAGMTLALTFVGCLLGFFFAFLFVLARQTPGWLAFPMRFLAICYVECFRRIPFLVVTYLVLFFIQAVKRDTSLFTVGVIAICLYASAYTAEIIRAGFESIARQQIEAATAMNFTRWQTLRYIIIPQSMPVIIPPSIIFMVGFIKDTALVSHVGIFELTFRGKELNNAGFSAFLVFGTIAVIYFSMSYPLARLGAWLEVTLPSIRNGKRSEELAPRTIL